MAKAKKLALADFRIDSFDHKVEGVEPITRAGTPVPGDKVAQVEKAAEECRVELKEVG